MKGSSQPSVAVIGCGYWGNNLVRNFNQLGAIGMVCDAGTAAQELARRLAPNARITGNVDDV